MIADHQCLLRAIQLAEQCPPTTSAFSVGAVIVDEGGNEISHGYSRESDPVVHAEESALAKLALADPRLPTATLYSSLEPCAQRKSRPRTCAQLIIDSGIQRVVFAWREPNDHILNPAGHAHLTDAGLTVVELPSIAIPNYRLAR